MIYLETGNQNGVRVGISNPLRLGSVMLAVTTSRVVIASCLLAAQTQFKSNECYSARAC